VEGFNFAFIDDYFDYHTANDTWQNLDLNSLQHQGSYLMPLLSYFSNSDISNLKSEEDFLYFNIPLFKIIKYPFQWIYPLLGSTLFIFIALIVYGRMRFRINLKAVRNGFLASTLSIVLSGVFGFLLWKLAWLIYPEYNDILHGFPYNGHYYILIAVLLSIGIFFRVYGIFRNPEELPSMLVAPLFFWMILCGASALYLPGASYFIIPVLFCLLCQFVLINQKRPFPLLMVLLCVPAIFIIAPFIASFPVALGIRIVFISSILTVLLCMLLLPVIGFYTRQKILSTVLFLAALIYLGISHFSASSSPERQKPNSLVYILHEDQQKAYWASYDHTIDSWTKNYINDTKNVVENWNKNTLESKFTNNFNYVNSAPLKDLASSKIEISLDSIYGMHRTLDISIRPQRNVNRMDLFMNASFNFNTLTANGVTPKKVVDKNGVLYNPFTKPTNNHLLTYFVRDKEALQLRMEFHKDSVPEIVLYESSYDLLENDQFTIPKRSETMIPKPFLINDAITIKKTLRLEYIERPQDSASLHTEPPIYNSIRTP